MMYERFASIYDVLMADVNYESWARHVLAIAAYYGVTITRAADCACGTGNLTIALAKNKIQMTGLDTSSEMLRIATEKTRALGMQIPFVRQDMRKLLLHRPMDALFCACDGVNYLLKPHDVKTFFGAAYRQLRPGGGFFFDVSSRDKLAHTLGNRCLGCDEEAISYIWQNHYEETTKTLQMDMSFFVLEADGSYSRFNETHLQRAYEAGELMDYLSDAGFQNVNVFGEQTLSAPTANEQRLHFAAVRPA